MSLFGLQILIFRTVELKFDRTDITMGGRDTSHPYIVSSEKSPSALLVELTLTPTKMYAVVFIELTIY